MWYTVIYLANELFPTPIRREDQKQVVFLWNGQPCPFMIFSHIINSLALCHIVPKYPKISRHSVKHHIDLLYWWHHINQTDDMTHFWCLCKIYGLHGVGNKPYKNSESCYLQSVGVQFSRAFQDITFKVKDNSLYFVFPQMVNKE